MVRSDSKPWVPIFPMDEVTPHPPVLSRNWWPSPVLLGKLVELKFSITSGKIPVCYIPSFGTLRCANSRWLKTKAHAPIAVTHQVTTTCPGNASNSATGGWDIICLQWQGSHLNGWNVAEILIAWQDKNPRGKSTFVLEHSPRNFALTGLFNDITMKKNWCLLKMKRCSYSVLNFGLQRTNLPRHTFSCI